MSGYSNSNVVCLSRELGRSTALLQEAQREGADLIPKHCRIPSCCSSCTGHPGRHDHRTEPDSDSTEHTEQSSTSARGQDKHKEAVTFTYRLRS